MTDLSVIPSQMQGRNHSEANAVTNEELSMKLDLVLQQARGHETLKSADPVPWGSLRMLQHVTLCMDLSLQHT